ncbi:MAG TPA: recombinase family protein [Candidatus Paceibacterota bacterium]
MKVILYARKSTDTEDKQVMSLDAQENELRKIAEREHLEIVTVYRESMSAKAPGRPLFAEMLKLITKGKADGILCWKIDRLARNPVDGGSISWMLQSGQIQAIHTYERIHLPSDNVLMLYVELGMSNQYIRELSANVKRGNREKLRRGEWPNHAPYGYRNDKNTKTLKVVKSQADKVRKVFDLYVTGKYSYAEIAKKLGIQKSLVERLLSKSFYYGMMERGGEQYPGIHTPIITKEIFDLAQQIKACVRVSPERPHGLFFTYRGLMRCAVCDCLLTATRKKGRYDYYYCTNGKGHCDQHKSYIPEKQVESFFADALTQIRFDEELIEIMYEAARERAENGSYDSKKTLDAIQYQIYQLQQQERKLLHSFTRGFIDESVYTEEAQNLQGDRKELEQKYKNYEANSQTSLGTLELTKQVFLDSNKAVSEFETATPERKQEIVKNLLWNFSVQDKKVLETKYKSPFQVLAKAPKKGDLVTMLPVRDSNPN